LHVRVFACAASSWCLRFGLTVYGENRVSVFCSICSCKGQIEKKTGCLFPASMLRNELFFVRVNRFWCVWMRALV